MLHYCVLPASFFHTPNFSVLFSGKFLGNKLYKEIVFCFVNNHVWDHLVHVFVVYDGHKAGS